MKHKVISLLFVLLFLAAYLGIHDSYRLASCIGILLVYLLVTALGSANIQWNYFVDSQSTLTEANQILLTFDDGPDPAFTAEILDILHRYNVKAVFFLIGEKVNRYPALVERIIKEGHMIGNHTYSHRSVLPFVSVKKLTEDIRSCSIAIKKVTGIMPVLFRPPFGVTTPRYAESIHQNNLQSIGWSVRSLDTISNDDKMLLQRIMRALKGGDILLLHDTQSITVQILPKLIEVIRAEKWILANPQNCFKNHLC